MKRDSGIYVIRCLVSMMVYVGQAVDLNRRWKHHQYNLAHRPELCNPHLFQAWQKYGAQAFVFGVLECCSPSKLDQREQHWIDKLEAFGPKGYNARPVAHSMQGYRFSPEACKRRSRITKKMWTEEHRAMISAKTRGRKKGPMSEAQKVKLSEALKGRKLPASHKLAIKRAMARPEVKRKVDASRGRRSPLSPASRASFQKKIKETWARKRALVA